MIFMLHRVEGSGMLLEFQKWNDMPSLCTFLSPETLLMYMHLKSLHFKVNYKIQFLVT
jgi:hypothetical protein